MTQTEKAKALLEWAGWTRLEWIETGREDLDGYEGYPPDPTPTEKRGMAPVKFMAPDPFTSIECAREAVRRLNEAQFVAMMPLLLIKIGDYKLTTQVNFKMYRDLLLASPADISEAVWETIKGEKQ